MQETAEIQEDKQSFMKKAVKECKRNGIYSEVIFYKKKYRARSGSYEPSLALFRTVCFPTALFA